MSILTIRNHRLCIPTPIYGVPEGFVLGRLLLISKLYLPGVRHRLSGLLYIWNSYFIDVWMWLGLTLFGHICRLSPQAPLRTALYGSVAIGQYLLYGERPTADKIWSWSYCQRRLWATCLRQCSGSDDVEIAIRPSAGLARQLVS